MKKPLRLLLTFIAIVIVVEANAQIAVGPKAGINWNSFRGNKAIDVIPGMNAGVFGRYPILPFLTARAEVLYFQQGANIIDYVVLPGNLERHGAQVVFHELQIPVLAEFGLPSLSEESLQPKIAFGGFYAWNFYSRERFTNVARLPGYKSVEYSGHDNVTAQYRSNQYGLVGAVGADLKILGNPVYLEFRYTHNLPAITKSGLTTRYNLENTFKEWGSDNLRVGTVSFSVAVTVQYF